VRRGIPAGFHEFGNDVLSARIGFVHTVVLACDLWEYLRILG